MALLDADVQQKRDALGEDTCELLATIEDSFGIAFPDYEAVLGKSVGELAELIANSSTYPKSDRCLSLVVFYLLRRALVESVGTARSKVRPDAPLAALLPWSGRRFYWRELKERLDLNLPALTMPWWLVALSLAVAVASSIALSSGLWEIFGSGLGWVGVTLCSFPFWIVSLRCLVPLARDIPEGCETFGEFTKVVLALNYAKIASQFGGTSQNEINSLLCRLIASEVGLNATDITQATRIPGDLNIY